MVFPHRLISFYFQTKIRKSKKFASVKRMINPKDTRLAKNQEKAKEKIEKANAQLVRKIPQVPSHLFFKYSILFLFFITYMQIRHWDHRIMCC